MEQQFDSPPELRLITRKFALTSSAPAGKQGLALQNMNTTKLQDGAVAEVYSLNGASVGITGVRTLYVFDRSYGGPPVSSTEMFTPSSGGGVWRRNGYHGMVSVDRLTGPVSPVTLTAGAGATAIYTHDAVSLGLGGQGYVVIDASVIVTPAVAGSVVQLDLIGGVTIVGAPPVYDTTLDTRTITMAVGEQMVVPLFGSMAVPYGELPNNLVLNYRIFGTATVQNASVPADGVTDRWQSYYIAGGG